MRAKNLFQQCYYVEKRNIRYTVWERGPWSRTHQSKITPASFSHNIGQILLLPYKSPETESRFAWNNHAYALKGCLGSYGYVVSLRPLASDWVFTTLAKVGRLEVIQAADRTGERRQYDVRAGTHATVMPLKVSTGLRTCCNLYYPDFASQKATANLE